MVEQIDVLNIVRRVFRQWLMILCLGVIVGLGFVIVTSHMYRPQFETKAIIVVTERDMSNAYFVADNAEKTASVFQEIINSSLLQNKVAEALEVDSLPGRIYCDVIQSTNMITLRVQANTPQETMLVMNGVLEHYNEVTEQLLGDMVLQVLEEPKVPTQVTEIYDGKKMFGEAFLATIVVVAVLMGGFFAFRDDIKNEKQVERKLDTRLFATIYHENKVQGVAWKQRRLGILVNNPVTSFGYVETFQKMCTKLSYQLNQKKHRLILVTSVMENEGKSTVAANLALTLAKRGNRVALVDGDLRKPAMFKLFDLDYDEGFVQIGSVLAGRDESNGSIQEIEDTGVWLLGGSRSYRNATKLLVSERAEQLFRGLRKNLDYVIVDTPPLYLATDAEELMRYADAGLLVVRQNVAKTKDINDAIDVFRKTGCRLMGCVLNDVETGVLGSGVLTSGGYGGRYGYGSYGRYDKKETAKEE